MNFATIWQPYMYVLYVEGTNRAPFLVDAALRPATWWYVVFVR